MKEASYFFRVCGRAAAAAAAALVCAATVCAQTTATPLDDKARYERSLEQKVEEVLLKMIGPSQAKVVVEATMDFTRTEKVDMTTSVEGNKEGAFKWGESSTENQLVSDYLLPGFPEMPNGGKPENTTYQKQMLFPSSFLKKLVVTVILNKDISPADAEAVRKVVSEVLALDQGRGDDLIIIRAPFAPFWRTIWYTPEAMGLIFKYGILAIMGIIALIVVAIGFLKLAGAMSTMAKAQQSHQITMDVGKDLSGMSGGGLSGPEGDPLRLAGGLSVGVERKESESGAPSGDGGPEKIIFNVKPEQVVFLVHLMNNEDPANIALVVTHLTPEVRSEFLRQLPTEISSDVLSHMAKVRFVEPDVVNTIKDELERRLSGTEGGVQQVIEIIDKVNLRAKRDMLEKLVAKDPDTARMVKSKVLMPEDIGRLSERDLSILVADFKIETLAMALWELPQAIKDAIRKQMAVKTWQMVEQTMKYGAPSRENAERAVEELMEQTLKLIRDGRISDPLTSGPALLAEPEAEKPEPGSDSKEAPPPPPPAPPESAPLRRD